MSIATDIGAQPLLEQWPILWPEVRTAITDIAESAAAEVALALADAEMESVARARADFVAGRTLSPESMRASLRRYFAGKP